jgi:hypothetical protein
MTHYSTGLSGRSQNTGLFFRPVYTPDSLVLGQTLTLDTDGPRGRSSLSGSLNFSWRWVFEEGSVQKVDGELLHC